MTQSIAQGAALTKESWDDFVSRLKYHVSGDGVEWHCTRDPVFNVERLIYDYGIDQDYGGEVHVCDDDTVYATPMAYYVEADKETQRALDDLAKESGYPSFSDAIDPIQLDWVEELGEAQVVGRRARWEHVNSHFTKEGAEAFIRRKAHDHRDGIRIMVDCSMYCWELNTIREAILNGKLRFVDE